MSALTNLYHLFLAWAGAVIYRHPSRRLYVVGVTGTKGKSTVVELINAVLVAAGEKTALLNSVRVKVADSSEPNPTSNTMPGRFALQRFLRRAADAGCAYAIIEVTSQGVVQNRHRFIDFDAAVFLNLHPEHLESHGSFEAYRAAKVRFFADVAARSKKQAKQFIINADDGASGFFADAIAGRGAVRYFSRERFVALRLGSTSLTMDRSGQNHDEIGDWFTAPFNLANAAAAEAFAGARGINWETVRAALKGFTGVPGRMEVIQERPFRVVVDYAHTPDSLSLVYETLASNRPRRPHGVGAPTEASELTPTPQLICVLGSAGGGRDVWKRPEFGRIAAAFCRDIILTDEDPYDELPEKIIKEIAEGCRNEERGTKDEGRVHTIVDRGEAIAKAVSLAREGDVVIITGKGSERSIHRARGARQPWSDREAVEAALGALNSK